MTESEIRPPPPARNRLHLLPDDWQPNQDHKTLARARGLHPRLDAIATKFRDYHWAKETRKGDWDLAFADWLRQEKGSKGGNVPDLGFV